MPVLVFSGKLRKNQKRPLVYEPNLRTYYNASKLIDAIFRDARIVVQRDRHIAVSRDGSKQFVTRVKYHRKPL